MSRSYKKTPYCGDHKGKSKKRIANHKVRNWLKQNPEVALKGSAYKKIYERWDICDYYTVSTWEEYWIGEIRFWLKWKQYKGYPYPNKKEEYCKWYKWYKMK